MSKKYNTYEVIYTEEYSAYVKAKTEDEALIKGKELWESDEQEEYFNRLYRDNEDDDWEVIKDNDYTGGDIYGEEEKIVEEPNIKIYLAKESSELQEELKRFESVWVEEEKEFFKGRIKALNDTLEWVNANVGNKE
jgi:phage anti-repressor protein